MKKLWTLLTALALALALTACSPIHIHIGNDKTANDGTNAPRTETTAGYTAGGGEIVEREGFRNIDIVWVSGSVTVERHDGQNVVLEETLADGSAVTGTPLEWRVYEDSLDIRSQPRLTDAAEEKHLTVKLPADVVLFDLEIETTSADVVIDLPEDNALSLKELDVTTVSGKIDAAGVSADELSLETTSGAVSGVVGTAELEADSVSGAITLTLTTTPVKVDIETTSGSVLLTLPAQGTSPLPVEFKTTSGKLTGDAPFTTVKDSEWEFQTVSGDVTLNAAK